METLAHLLSLATRHAGTHAVPRLSVVRYDRATALTPLVFEPSVCLVLQGTKRTVIGAEVLTYGAGSCLVVAAEVAALGQITEATPDQPYLGFSLTLDLATLSEVMAGMADFPLSDAPGFRVEPAAPLLLDAWRRLVDVLDRPAEIPLLARLHEQELLFRLMAGPLGAILRQIASQDSALRHIRRVMDWIRAHHPEPITIADMAKLAGMSLSVFHRRFREVTGLSPLQYQKHLRLHDAKRRLAARTGTATTVAFAVGYESPSQFSREYKRLFGCSPMRDAEAMTE